MSQILTSAPPPPQKKPISETLEVRTQRIREKLRAQRAQSELIYDIAVEMLEIDRLGLWQAATGTDAPVEKKTKKTKKKNALTREVWAPMICARSSASSTTAAGLRARRRAKS